MRARAATVALLLIVSSGCGGPTIEAESSTSNEPIIEASHESTVVRGGQVEGASLSPAIAGQLVGTWHATSEICEPDSDEKPSKKVAPALLTLKADGHYRKVQQGEDLRGSFTVYDASQNVIGVQLDDAGMLMRYLVKDGRLENWGEGDAVYLCALVFERMK